MQAENIIQWFKLYNDKIKENKSYLTELDGPIGDSDHGANMARGMSHVMDALEEETESTPAELLKTIAMQLMSKVGGASGALYGSAFLGMSKAITEDDIQWAEVIDAGIAMIKKRGKSDSGEKTMLDVWVPVQEALHGGSLTREVIEEAVQSTEAMKATKGRASYVGERSIGHTDPGAASSGLLFEAAIEAEVF
ncbi:dihydroxyacetone kinase subunit L [Aerococcaceae bacterium DSM 111020]|nr:dihydroxyacetone kinase subunit L [Aerococcaceae bacterium DSM 111020]